MSVLDGFNTGQKFFAERRQAALDFEQNKRQQELFALQKEQLGLQLDEGRARAETARRARGLDAQMGDMFQGVDRPASNANQDADFEQAYQATKLGLQAPAMVGGSNAANEAALTVRRPVDPSAPEFQQGLNTLRMQRALTTGDMADFDRVNEREQGRALTQNRRTEYKRVQSLSPQELAEVVGSRFNSMPYDQAPGMIDYDSSTKKFVLVSKIPGVPTQSFTRAEMEQIVMSAWEAGNGDYDKGVQGLLSAAMQQRTMESTNFDRSLNFANANANLDFKNRELGLKERQVKAAEGRIPRELKPETVAALNDLRDKISQEPDPAKRRQLENDWNRMYSMASTELGRVVMPRSQAEVGPLDKERLTAYYKALENLGPTAPQGQVDALAARFGVKHLLNGSDAGGLPGWGDKPDPGPDKETADNPVVGLRPPGRAGAAARAAERTRLLQEFNQLPEVQALQSQIDALRNRTGRSRTDATQSAQLARQLATLREQFMKQNLGQ